MNRLLLCLATLILLPTGAASLVVSSNVEPTSYIKPSSESATQSRPTLKRRAPTADKSSSAPESTKNEPEEQEKCKAGTVQNLVTLKFEGLNAFDKSEVLKRFREQGVTLSEECMPDFEATAGAVAILKKLLQSNGYARARVDVLRDEESKSITFLVDEGTPFAIAEIRFEGNSIFSSQALLARLRECLANYQVPRKTYDAEVFDLCLRRLTTFIRSQGYLQGIFNKPSEQINQSGLVLTIPVQEGAVYYLGRIEIEGLTLLSTEQVRAMLALKDGDIVDAEAIGKWLFEDLKKVYDDLGYLHFTADAEPEFKVVGREGVKGIVDFKVSIEEGQQFRIRSIGFKGATFSEESIRPLLVIREGDIFNRRLFENSVEKLNDSRLFEFIDKDKDVDFNSDEEDSLLDIVIKITERHPLHSPRVVFYSGRESVAESP